jgi:hypothetical protein
MDADTRDRGGRMADITEAYEALEGIFRDHARSDGTMAINFITYFGSRETFNDAFDELSLVELRDGNLHLPPGISAKAQIDKERGGIPLLFFQGRFTIDQAKEVVRVFSEHADQAANARHLPAIAADFGSKLAERGGGGLVWVEWEYTGG